MARPKQQQPAAAPKPSLVSLLCCTGGRPEAFEFCQKQIIRQTYRGPIQLVVTYDCAEAPKIIIPENSNIKVELYRSSLDWRPGINTQRPQMVEGMKHILGESIFIWEDDDHFSPNYIEVMLKLLRDYEVVGEVNSVYYNVKERSYKQWCNMQHASLCQTALRKKHLDVLDEAVNSGELFFDISLWRKIMEKKIPYIMFHGQSLVVGIKNLPGKRGIGAGHRPEGFIRDPGFDKLRELVGEEDTLVYRNMIKSSIPLPPEHKGTLMNTRDSAAQALTSKLQQLRPQVAAPAVLANSKDAVVTATGGIK